MNNLKFNEPIFVTRPLIPPIESYNKKLQEIWDNKWLTNYGPLEREFQIKLKEKYGLKNIETFANGHISLEIALKALDLEGEVITTPFTFASTTQAIIGNRLTPVFADIDQYYYNLNPENIEDLITDKTSAIVPVHVFGNPCELDKMAKIAKDYDLKLIYDAAHAFGVEVNGNSIFNYGDISMISFHATKVFNTIEGGALIFEDNKLIEKFKALKNFGITPNNEEIQYLGKNGKMNEFEAAMGLCNMDLVDDAIKERELVYKKYLEELKDLEDEGILKMIKPQENTKTNYAYFTIKLNSEELKDYLFYKLPEYNLFVKRYFYPPCNEFPAYDFEKNTPIAQDVSYKILSLPIYAGLRLENVCQICEIIKTEIRNFNSK